MTYREIAAVRSAGRGAGFAIAQAAGRQLAAQPVLDVEPTSGGSTRYSIVDFRPAFLTDESSES